MPRNKPINRFEIQVVTERGGYIRWESRRDPPHTPESIADALEKYAEEIRHMFIDRGDNFSDRIVERDDAAAPVPPRGAPTQGRPLMFFRCPACGDPGATTVEPEVDIHSGAVYTCADCGKEVIFSAQTPDEYSRCVMAAAPSATVKPR